MASRISSSSARSSKSGIQKEVLSLYRAVLRTAIKKDRSTSSAAAAAAAAAATSSTPSSSSSSKLSIPYLLSDQSSISTNTSTTTHNAKLEFRRQASSIPRKDFRTIEHYIRQGYKKIKTLEMVGSTGFVSVSGVRDGGTNNRNDNNESENSRPKRYYSTFVRNATTTNDVNELDLHLPIVRKCSSPLLPMLFRQSNIHNRRTTSNRQVSLFSSSSYDLQSTFEESSVSTLLPQLKQGSTLSFRTDHLPPNIACHVTIRSGWRDDGDVSVAWSRQESPTTNHEHNGDNDGFPKLRLVVVNDDDDDESDPTKEKMSATTMKRTSLGRDEPFVSLRVQLDDYNGYDSRMHHSIDSFSSPTALNVTINVPEKINLDLDLGPSSNRLVSPRIDHDHGVGGSGGFIDVIGKIEGDVRLRTTKGNITATKLRGYSVDLSTADYGSIYISDVVEAQDLNIHIPYDPSSPFHHRVRAKRIHTNTMTISVNEADTEKKTASRTETASLPETDDDDSGAIVDISSLYVIGDANIVVRAATESPSLMGIDDDHDHHSNQSQRPQAVRIKSHHGHVNVETNLLNPTVLNGMTNESLPLVDCGGVNGSCELLISLPSYDGDGESEPYHISTRHQQACHVHFDSIVPDSVSLLQSDWGHIHVTADRKVEADVRLLSLGRSSSPSLDLDTFILENDGNDDIDHEDHLKTTESIADELVRMLKDIDEAVSTTSIPNEEHDNNLRARIEIETKAFTERPMSTSSMMPSQDFQTIQFIDGWIENKSAEPDSRFDRKLRGTNTNSGSAGGGVGKIRLDGAQEQALQTFQKSPTSNGDDSSTSRKNSNEFSRPLLAVCTPGTIRLETLSWLGNIARRYGLDDKRDTDDLGRQATRRRRL